MSYDPNKIDLSLTINSRLPSKIFLQKLQRLIDSDSADSFFIMPNWEQNIMRSPTGLIMKINKDKPFKSDCFCTDLFFGTTIVQVKNFNESIFYVNHQDRIQSLQKIHDQDDIRKLPSIKGDIKSNNDLEEWFSFKGNSKSTIGLYAGTVFDANTQCYGRKWFIICTDGLCQPLLDDLEQYFIDCEQSGKTFEEILIQDETVQRCRNIAKRNRKKRISEIANALQLDIEEREDIVSVKNKDGEYPKLAYAWKETESFIYKLNRQDIFFYSDATCISLCKGDVIITRMPYQGPILILGPETTSTSHRSNRSWSARNTTTPHASGGFLSRYLENPSICDLKYTDLPPNVFIGHDKYKNTNKHVANITAEISKIEYTLGRDVETFPRPVEFEPILVII
jgi:hypothetical protein